MRFSQFSNYLHSLPAMDVGRSAVNLPNDQYSDHDQHIIGLPPTENRTVVAVGEPMVDDGNQPAVEDAQFILGRNVAFSIIPSDDAFDVQEVVETLSNAPANSNIPTNATTTISVPRNKVASFNEALREHLVRRSRRVIEKAGRMAFWRGKEPFMRPVLSRSLSLP